MANQNFKVKKGLEVGTGVTISDGNINISGIITAQFKGDGSQLTGVTAAGSGVVVQEEGSSVGTAATINFIGSNVTAALSGGVANVTVSAGGLSDVVSDTDPQLGGNLDLNSKDITGTGNISITGGINATGVSTFQENVNFTSTASFGDNDKINVGAGNDLQIYHDGTDSIIKNTTGRLKIEPTGIGLSILGDARVTGILSVGQGTITLNSNTNGGTMTLGSLTLHRDSGSGDAILMNTGGTYNPFRASKFLIDATPVIDHDRNFIGVGATFTGRTVLGAGNTTIVIDGAYGTVNATGIITAARFDGSGVGLSNVSNAAASSVLVNSESNNNARVITFAGTTAANVYAGVVANNNFKYNPSTTELFVGAGVTVKGDSGINVTGVITATSFSGSGSALTGLTAASAGTYGASNNTPIITVDSNGRITGIATVATAGAEGGGGMSNIVEDTTPQLGGDLDLNGNDITGTGNITLTSTDAGSSAGPEFKLFRNSASPADADYIGQIKFAGESDTGAERNYAKITGKISDASNGTEDGIIEIAHIKAGSQNISARWTSTELKFLNGTNVSMADGLKLLLGTGDDVDIYHDGTDGYFRNTTGQLLVRGNDIKLQSYLGETYATFANNGAASLYHDNTLKFATSATGATVTGTLAADGITLGDSEALDIGASQDLQLIHDGSNSYINATVGGDFYIRGASGGTIRMQALSNEESITADANGAVSLYYDNSKKFETTNTGVTVTGAVTGTTIVKSGGSSSQYLMADGSVSTTVGISTNTSNIQVTYDVTSNGSSAYRFTGPGNDGADDNPDLYLVKGQRYRFTNSSGGSHPFQIRASVGGSAYSAGVTNNGAASGNIEWNVQHDAPARLYYQCTAHSGMVGNIYITGGGQWQNTSVAASGTPEIYTDYNVGIGTVNPSRRLHAEGTSVPALIKSTNNNYVLEMTGNNHDHSVFLGCNNANDFLLANESNDGTFAERLRIDSDGKIGVNNNAPLYPLHFKNAMATTPSYIHMEVTGTNTVGGGGGIQFDTSASSDVSNNGLYLAQISGERSSSNNGSNSLIFKTTKSGAAGDDGNTHSPKTRMVISEDGNIGIGTTVPNILNSAAGGAPTLQMGNGTGSPAMVLYSSTSTQGQISFADGLTGDPSIAGYILYSHSSNHFAFGTSSNERFRITSTGQLQATSAADVRLTLGSSGTAGTNDSVHIRADSADLKFMAASGGTTMFEVNGTETLRIDSGGRIAQGGRTPTSHGSPNLLLWGADPTMMIASTGSTANTSYTGIKFAVAGGSTGDYSKAGIFVQRQASYNDLDMIFAFRSSNDAAGVTISDEKVRINSDGNVCIGGSQDNGRLTVQGTVGYSGNSLILYEYTKASQGGIRVIGGEASVEIIGSDSGTHGADVMLRYANDGFIMNANPTDDTLDINAFTASVNGFTSHASGGNQSYWKQIVKFHRDGGISFNGDTADANKLEDYEEGTFTPAILRATSNPSVSYTYQNGKYTKVGNMVLIYFDLNISSISGGSGRYELHGLPFSSSTDTSSGGYGSPQFRNSTAFGSVTPQENPSSYHIGTTINLRYHSNASTESDMTITTGRITGWSMYFTAS